MTTFADDLETVEDKLRGITPATVRSGNTAAGMKYDDAIAAHAGAQTSLEQATATQHALYETGRLGTPEGLQALREWSDAYKERERLSCLLTRPPLFCEGCAECWTTDTVFIDGVCPECYAAPPSRKAEARSGV